MITSRMARSVVGLLLPPSCMCCAAALDDDSGVIRLCPACREELSALVSQQACPRCARSIGPYGSCAACGQEPPPFEAAVRIGVYDGPLSHLVRIVKYRGVRYAAPLMARLLMAKLHQNRVAERIDLVTAVPLYWWRFYRRGYNQAVLLARELRRQGLPVALKRVLVRIRDTRPQVGLSRTARLANVRGAFRVRRPKAVRGRRVLLVDDVMTTGATAETCARTLLAAGARSVTVAVAAVAESHRQALAS